MKIEKPKSLTVFVIFSISVVIIYSIINIVSKYHDVEISDTLTTCVYAFFGGEVVSCALIKIFKLKEDLCE